MQHTRCASEDRAHGRNPRSLSQPNIAGSFGLEESAGAPWLVLELIEGETLAQRLTRGRLTVRETLEIGGQTAAGVEAAHERGIDRRADVWAFGCVLFEALSGHEAFGGETLSDVIACVLEREPEWNALPATVPPRLRDVVRRCLTKDAEERPRDIGACAAS